MAWSYVTGSHYCPQVREHRRAEVVSLVVLICAGAFAPHLMLPFGVLFFLFLHRGFGVRGASSAIDDAGVADVPLVDWACQSCTFYNRVDELTCAVCSTPYGAPGAAANVPQPWGCSTCTYMNVPSATQCIQCDSWKPTDGAGTYTSKHSVSRLAHAL